MTFRGGRSGPTAANASTVGTTVANTVGAGSVAGTPGIVVRMAPNEQQEAQALHFCLAAGLAFAMADPSSATAASADARESKACADPASP
ncbi:MAG: hypothetical protein Q7U73_15965 [Rubrivivax sp.]|nr:hypothetical protein [Rubrivivax sp.]